MFLKGLVNQLKLILILFVGFLLVITTFSVNFDWPNQTNQLQKLVYLNRFLTDFFQFGSLVILLYSGNMIARSVSILLTFVVTSIYFIQSHSYATAKSYLPVTALENIQHIGFLDVDQLIVSGLIWSTLFILIFFSAHIFVKKISFKSGMVMALILLTLSIIIKNDDKWLAEKTIGQRFQFYNSGRAGVERNSPIAEFSDTLKEYVDYLKQQKFIVDKAGLLSKRVAEFAYGNYEFLGKIDPEFPLIHTTSFDKPIDFLPSPVINKDQPPTKMNIIIFFAEGMSAKLVQPYHDYFPGLTPNINEFSKKAIRINNYYNHTFATYRGLAGQLCSLFPVGVLKNISYHCLSHVLQNEGYQSRFMVSQQLRLTNLDEVFSRAGFDEVDGARDIADLLSIPQPVKNHCLSDQTLIKGLIKRLENIENTPSHSSPFMIGLYNFETHTGAHLIEDSTTYTNPNEQDSTYLLNTFHNFDKEFGRFWNYFQTSSFYDNTIVVLTTDHATFPSRDYKALMENVKDYKSIFVDKIPLLIYHPNVTSAPIIDAKGATSIDFAPSLLHLLGINNIQTPFLGSSLFSGDVSPYKKTAGTPSNMWYRDSNDNWHHITEKNKGSLHPKNQIQGLKYDFLRYLWSLENSNHLWNSEPKK